MVLRRNLLSSAAALTVMALLLLRADIAAEAVQQGLSLCVRSLLPALFPFFVTVSFAVNAGLFHTLRRCGISPAAAVFILGALGGYPLGARTAGEVYRAGLLSKQEAERLLSCCNNAGPAFILTVVGRGIFQSRTSGLVLWGIHLLAALVSALLFCQRSRHHNAAALPPPCAPSRAFLLAVGSGAEAMLHLSAFVVFFSVVTTLLPLPPLLAGLLELTVGITSLSPTRTGFSLSALLLGWGGVSVCCQTAAVLSDTDLSVRYFLAGKSLQALLCAAAAWCIYPFI